MIKTLRIQLTDECNLRCIYCCNEGTRNEYSIIKNKNVSNFIRACYDVLGIKRIKFTGGEPLEYDEDISKIVALVPDRNDIAYSIVTNATNISKFKDIVEKIPNIDVAISLPVPIVDNVRERPYDLYKDLTGAYDERNALDSVIECIEYMKAQNKAFKINYVLCKNRNTSKEKIKAMIDYVSNYNNVRGAQKINLRFLETAVNITNSPNDEMKNCVFSAGEFEDRLCALGYADAVENKIHNSRAYSEYMINYSKIRLIKFFCNDECNCCPKDDVADKTSLWLTSMGRIKKCSYKVSSIPIEDWRYNEICHQLESVFFCE